MVYLLDANVFIQAKNLHYGFDFCPAFWDWIIDQDAKGRVKSIEKIGDELEAGQDDLATWAKTRGDGFFLKPDQEILSATPNVSTWVKAQKYQPAAVNTFFQVADYWLVAHALAHKCTVVTHEIASDGVTKVKIPNVCIGLKVKWMTPYEMLRHERAKFVLGTEARDKKSTPVVHKGRSRPAINRQWEQGLGRRLEAEGVLRGIHSHDGADGLYGERGTRGGR